MAYSNDVTLRINKSLRLSLMKQPKMTKLDVNAVAFTVY